MNNHKKLQEPNPERVFGATLSEERYSALVRYMATASLNDVKEYYFRIHPENKKIKENIMFPWDRHYIGYLGCCDECNELCIALALLKVKGENKELLKHFTCI